MREVQYVLLYTGYAPGPRIGYTLAHCPVLNEHEMRVKGLSLSRGARFTAQFIQVSVHVDRAEPRLMEAVEV